MPDKRLKAAPSPAFTTASFRDIVVPPSWQAILSPWPACDLPIEAKATQTTPRCDSSAKPLYHEAVSKPAPKPSFFIQSGAEPLLGGILAQSKLHGVLVGAVLGRIIPHLNHLPALQVASFLPVPAGCALNRPRMEGVNCSSRSIAAGRRKYINGRVPSEGCWTVGGRSLV